MSSNNNSKQPVVPSAREAMDKFKMEAAQQVGVNLKKGYNGDLTSREAGSVGGQMVKKMIEAYESGMQGSTCKGAPPLSGAEVFDRLKNGPRPYGRGPFCVGGKIAYFTPIQPEMTIRWTSEVPS